MERIIQIAAKLPASSRNGQKLTGNLINQIWISLQHPPLSYVGPQFQYRMADGSNNVTNPSPALLCLQLGIWSNVHMVARILCSPKLARRVHRMRRPSNLSLRCQCLLQM